MSSARRRSGSALATALGIALLSFFAVGPLRAETPGALVRLEALTRDVTARLGALDGLRAQVGRLSDGLAEIRARVAEVRNGMAGADERVRDAGEALRAKQQQLEQRTAAAEAGISWSGFTVLAAPDSLTAASAPLAAVSTAIRAGDGLMVEVLAQQADVHRQEASVDGLLTQVRSSQFGLATLERQLQAGLVGARRVVRRLEVDAAETEVPVGNAQGVITEAERRLHDVQTEQLELRQVEAELLSARVLLTDRQQMLLGKLGAARRTVDNLYQDMAQAEALVSTWLPSLTGVAAGSGGPSIDGVLRVCPVDRPHAYFDDFGAPRFAGGFHLHEGNDIFAPPGTPIRAPFSGVAVEAPNRLGGNAVIVYGRVGYAYNAHLSAYGTLGPVTVGTIIGYVGNTGDAKRSAPHDHFEWHPGNGPAVDPFPYLNAVC